MNKANIAQVAHEINRAFCQSIGDSSQLPWNEAAEWQRESAIKGVEFKINNPDAAPSAQHEAWSKDKTDAGWTYGEVKDEAAKTHPCLVAYDELPTEQKSKDYLFIQVVESLKTHLASQ